MLFIAAQCGFAETTPEHMQLFLLIGQSNMAGRGKVEPQDEVTNPRIFMLTQARQWVPAKDPLHFDKPKMAGVGLGSEFARQIVAKNPKATVGLIPSAMGGTSLDEWKPGGKLYTEAVARTREAMKHGTLTGILWHQGEADSSHEKVLTYGKRFAAMIAQLRKDLQAENVPVVVGELGRFRQASREFNAALPEVSRQVPLCTFVTAENLTDKGDQLHFDAPSLRILGQRYAAAFLTLKTQAAAGKAN